MATRCQPKAVALVDVVGGNHSKADVDGCIGCLLCGDGPEAIRSCLCRHGDGPGITGPSSRDLCDRRSSRGLHLEGAARRLGVAGVTELNVTTDVAREERVVCEASGHGDNKAAPGSKQLAKAAQGFASVKGRDSLKDVDSEDAVKGLGGPRKSSPRSWAGRSGNVALVRRRWTCWCGAPFG